MLLSITEVHAQFGWVRNKSLGPGIIWDAVQEPDGGLTILGEVSVDVNTQKPYRLGLTCHPDARSSVIWLARLDSNWDIVWEQCYGGSRHEYPRKLIKRNDSTYAVFFSTESEDGDFSGNHRLSELGVMIVNQFGELDTISFYGGSAIEGLNSVAPTSDGGFIIGCHSNSGDGDVPGHHGSVGGIYMDVWIVKLDSALIIEWTFWWGGSDHDDNVRAVQWIDGSYAIAASSASSDYDLAGNTPNYGDVWLIKLDKSGSRLWQKRITEGPAYDYTYDVLVDSDSNLVVVGKRDNFWCDSAGRKANMWAAKVDTGGNVLWDACYGDRDGDYYLNYVSEIGEGYILNGYVYDTGGDVNETFGSIDDWLVQIDRTGDILWEKNIGGSKTDGVIGFLNGHHLLGFGNTNSNDHDLLGVRDSTDYTSAWLFEVELYPVGMDSRSEQPPTEFLTVYPNPTSNTLQVELLNTQMESGHVAIYNASGALCWQKFEQHAAFSIPTSSFPPGFYILTVSDRDSGMMYSAPFSVLRH